MRTNYVTQEKKNDEKSFWETLSTKLGVKSQLLKFASPVSIDRPREIVKPGMVISYGKGGDYTIKLGHKADIVVKGVAKAEKEMLGQIRTALSYLSHINPRVAKELKVIEAGRRDLLVYIDIDRCRDCVWYESDTSHETYRDKCKNCMHATLGGTRDIFFPRSQQLVVFTPLWDQIGGNVPREAFMGTMSLLDAHRKGMVNERSAESIANDVIRLAYKNIYKSLSPEQKAKWEENYKQQRNPNLDKKFQTIIDKNNGVEEMSPEVKPKFEEACREQGNLDQKFKGIMEQNALNLGTSLMNYFSANKINFQKYAKPVINIIEAKTGLTMHEYNKATKSVRIAFNKKAESNINIDNLTIKDEGKFKLKLKDKSEGSEDKEEKKASIKKAEGEIGGDVKFQKYERVHMKSDPKVTGTWMETQDSKPGDVDDIVVLDKAFEGFHVIEIMPVDLESDGTSAEGETKEFANTQFAQYKKDIGQYEKDFETKVENVMSKGASKDKKEKDEMPGALKKPQVEALEEYEKEPKDNYIKSKEIMPKGAFEGTLCIAQVK
jgi:hypothetical protein